MLEKMKPNQTKKSSKTLYFVHLVDSSNLIAFIWANGREKNCSPFKKITANNVSLFTTLKCHVAVAAAPFIVHLVLHVIKFNFAPNSCQSKPAEL